LSNLPDQSVKVMEMSKPDPNLVKESKKQILAFSEVIRSLPEIGQESYESKKTKRKEGEEDEVL